MTTGRFGRSTKGGKTLGARAIATLECRIEIYKEMVKWPALIESLERDLAALKARQASRKK